MRTYLAMIVWGALACGNSPRPATIAHDDRSWTEDMRDAQAHDQLADEHDRAADAAAVDHVRAPDRVYSCGDTVLNDQLTTGGTRVTSWQPCFDTEEEVGMSDREAAVRERRAARRDRRAAAQLAEAEVAACAAIPEREREHSVFEHRKEIADVVPYREDGQLRGVRIVFKPVHGLSSDWLRRDISCHRAQWAVLGTKPKVEPSDPTIVPGAVVEVLDRDGHIEVMVTTDSPESAELVVSRARKFAPAAHAQTAVR